MKPMQHMFAPIHIKGGDAWIQGEGNRLFPDLQTLLQELGCDVEELDPEVVRAQDWIVPMLLFSVVFPKGAKIIKHPKDSTPRTASGRRRKGAQRRQYSPNDRKGLILIPGEETDYIVTWYRRDGESPEFISKTVQEVEKD